MYKWILGGVVFVLLLASVVWIDGLQVNAPSPINDAALVDLEEQYRALDPSIVGVLVEFSDFQCPFCARAAPNVDQIRNAYGNRLPVVYMHYPLETIHPQAFQAAVASECAQMQGRFWEYHDVLFENQDRLQYDFLIQYAASLNLDTQQFSACLQDEAVIAQVNADKQLGSMLGVQGTPTFFVVVNGKSVMLEGSVSAAQINAAVQELSKT